MNDLQLVKGTVGDPSQPTVYAIMRDEMFFLPSFFAHYRKLGFKQFVILNDRSVDGSSEFLEAQPDCAILKSSYTFSDVVDGHKVHQAWKNWIPERFLQNSWGVCVDADEFLFLPPQFQSVQAFCNALDSMKATAVGALMIDFYPETVFDLDRVWKPGSLEELLAAYPHYDRGPYITWKKGSLRPKVLSGGVRERLLRKYNVNKKQSNTGLKGLLRRLKAGFSTTNQVGSIHKVPFVRWKPGLAYLHSHTLNAAPDGGTILPMIHFKFTSAFKQKLDVATRVTKLAERAFAYNSYDIVLERMKADGGSFVSPSTLSFTSPAALFELSRIVD
ncbi:glycosyltransferase family 2 protein [Aestuariivirga sp.]|uniref:glycosyltransferase family 2 protein n=1 Tax=Aestuariivirga sp. TaxID=2650926 RepID=UPI0039E40C52